MSESTADCEFSILMLRIGDGEPFEVDINGLPVEQVKGAQKAGETEVEVVQRRGVRMRHILERAGVEGLEDDMPVTGIGRDGYDPLRTRLQGDLTRLPRLSFVRDSGYVYLGYPGDKDPLYPEMEGRSLAFDYDLATDDEVPEELGGSLASIKQFRWKMLERIDEQTYGMLEIDPVP